MEFTLTSEIVDLIVFAMENQEDEFLFDTVTGELISIDEILQEYEETEERYVPIPEWTPADGFRLMERFVGSLQNPVYSEKLAEALSAGRGVFRRFKDTVKEHPEIERRWHSFKDQAMREAVNEWYNDLRETWGLERLAFEQQETEDLVLSDFAVHRVSEDEDRRVQEVRRLTREQDQELGSGPAPRSSGRADQWTDRWSDGTREHGFRGSIAFLAEAPRGETAAVVWALGDDTAGDETGGDRRDGGEGSRREPAVRTLYVAPVFRGLGLGRLLLERLVETARGEGWSRVSLELAGGGLVLESTVSGLGFQVVSKRVALDLS